MRVAVVGGSIAGLASALALSRGGHEVTLVERDPQPLPPSAELAASSWRRGGVPQVHQPHGFVCRIRSELRSHAPDVWSALLDAGAVELKLFDQRPASLRGLDPESGDDDLAFLQCRRTTFEWVLRRIAEQECAIRIGTRVDGYVVEGDGADQKVVGLSTSAGVVDVDLVVEASGRSGGLGRRLREIGFVSPPGSDEPCGIEYTSRFYRLRAGAQPGPLNRMWAAGGMFAGYSAVLFPHDADTFSIGFGRLPDDSTLAAVHTTAGFERAVARVPFVAEWVDPARSEPLGSPVPMAGIRNALSGSVRLRGLVAIGDAVCTTNPAFGRGAALALSSGFMVARCVEDSSGDAVEASERFGAWFADEVVPWHADAVAQDRVRTAAWQAAIAESAQAPSPAAVDPSTSGPQPATSAAGGGRPAAPTALVVAAGVTGADPVAWRGFVRYAGMLAPPSSLQADDVVERVGRLLDGGWSPTAVDAPSHREMAEIVQRSSPA